MSVMLRMNEDVITEIVKRLPLLHIQKFLSTNKQLFQRRIAYIKQNPKIMQFAREYNGAYYFNILYNSHIKINIEINEFTFEPRKSHKETIYNTIDMMGFLKKETALLISTEDTNKKTKEYINKQLKINTGFKLSKNELDVYFEKISDKYMWYCSDVYFYDIFEIILYAKHRKYAKVKECLENIKFKSLSIFDFTLQKLLDITFNIQNIKSRAIAICLIYYYIDHTSSNITNKRNFILTIIDKTQEFIASITNLRRFPNYMKTFIVSKLIAVNSKMVEMLSM